MDDWADFNNSMVTIASRLVPHIIREDDRSQQRVTFTFDVSRTESVVSISNISLKQSVLPSRTKAKTP